MEARLFLSLAKCAEIAHLGTWLANSLEPCRQPGNRGRQVYL